MSWRDRVTDALGGALGSGLDLLTQSFAKANGRPDPGARGDEPAFRPGGSNALVPDDAGVEVLPPKPSGQDPRALLWDPFALIDQLGYRDRPTSLTYATLRELAKRVPTYAAILQTRLTQVSAFTQLQADPRDAGFGVVLRDREKSPTKIERKRSRELEDWLLQTGSTWQPGRDNFRTFIRKLTRDSLCLDQGVFEVVRNRKGEPAEFYAVDAGTIRIADVPPGAEATFDPNQVKFVQVYDEIIIGEFAGHDLCFGVRNPRTEIRANGYGLAELEILVNTVTATLWSLEYNKRQFCLTASTPVWTDRGMVPIEELVEEDFRVWTGTKWAKAVAVETEQRPVVSTRLWNGLEAKTSPEHQFRVIQAEQGEIDPQWLRQEQLKRGDWLLLGYGQVDVTFNPELFLVGKEYPVNRSTQNPWRVTPEVVADPEFWEMIGFALGDGYFPPRKIQRPGWMLIQPHHEKDQAVFDLIRRVCIRHGINLGDARAGRGKYGRPDGLPVLKIHHANFIRWLYDMGFHPSSEGKIVPSVLFQAPAWIRRAVMKGLFSADGHSRHHQTGYVTPTVRVTDYKFRQSVLSCMWSIGVATQDMGSGPARIGNLEVQDIPSFVERVGYIQEYKNEGIERSERAQHRWDKLPPKVCRALAVELQAHPNWLTLDASERELVGRAVAGRSNFSRPRARQYYQRMGLPLPECLQYVNVQIDEVDLDPIGHEQMFDIEVDDPSHTFLANFMAVHNSQGFMGAGGILNFKGAVSDEKVDAFRRQWKMMVSGVTNSHRVPMTNVDELQWIDLGKSNRDMEFMQYMDFLIKITAAVCQFDPAEINFNYGNSGQTSQMGGTNNPAAKVGISQDRGLRPLLKDISQWINQYLIWPLAPDFELEFMGLDAKDQGETAKLGEMESWYKKTVDELRAEDDLPPLPDGAGQIILNPTWLQAKQAAAMAAGGGQPTPEGAEGFANGDTDVAGIAADSQDDQEDVEAGADDQQDQFDRLFPQKAERAGDLRKAGKRAKVRVFEIDL